MKRYPQVQATLSQITGRRALTLPSCCDIVDNSHVAIIVVIIVFEEKSLKIEGLC
jgi:hypothetical protein